MLLACKIIIAFSHQNVLKSMLFKNMVLLNIGMNTRVEDKYKIPDIHDCIGEVVILYGLIKQYFNLEHKLYSRYKRYKSGRFSK